jgi:hypothetical protein
VLEQCRPVTTDSRGTSDLRGATVVVVGLGDLGARVAAAVARLPVGRVVAISREAGRAAEVAGQAAVIAGLAGGAERVEGLVADVGEAEGMAATLRALDPAVIVMAASRHTWWRTPAALDGLPYGAWLPLQVGLTRELVRARDAAGSSAPVVALPFPDAVGPVLAPSGLAPDVGAGNVAEIAAKLAMLAAADAGVPRDEVTVRLIAHHAVERVAFSAFSALAGRATTGDAPAGRATTGGVPAGDGPAGGGPARDPGPPPWRAAIAVGGEPVPDEQVREWFATPHPLLPGRQTHVVTATATTVLVEALLGDAPRRVHVPAPGGRPGGYPAVASSSGVTLDLPDGVPEPHAVAINATAARWDGIERIDGDGTVTFTAEVAEATERLLGLRLATVRADEMDPMADELETRLHAAGSRETGA